MNGKAISDSKTIWVNVTSTVSILLGMFVPPEYLPIVLPVAYALVNVGLRFLTNTPLGGVVKEEEVPE